MARRNYCPRLGGNPKKDVQNSSELLRIPLYAEKPIHVLRSDI
jgi:hypothetical protein